MTVMLTAAIVDALERAPALVVSLVRQAAPAIVKRRPPSGKWSIHEHACHLAEVHALFNQRLDLMLSRDCPTLKSYDPGRDDAVDRLLNFDLEIALDRYQGDRALLVDRIRLLTPEEWQRTARHDEYNSYSVFTMFRHLALHDLFHAYRIEELVLRRDWPAPQGLL
jgi:hypothetical protein